MSSFLLRDVVEEDLPIFFDYQRDLQANYMAAFTAKDPADHAAFLAHWQRILADATIINKTIVSDGRGVGSVSSYEDDGRPEVTYWIGREYWGRGSATRTLTEFLQQVNTVHPIYARVAKDNLAFTAGIGEMRLQGDWEGQWICQRPWRGNRRTDPGVE